MLKLDWYILKKFLVTFFFCLLLFTVIAVAVDSSEKTDDFVKTGLGTADIIKKYYLGFIPHIWSLLFPLFVFIAVIFFTSKNGNSFRDHCHSCEWYQLQPLPASICYRWCFFIPDIVVWQSIPDTKSKRN